MGWEQAKDVKIVTKNFGVPDSHWGEAVHAVVVVHDEARGADLVTELREHCRKFVAGYKVPKRIDLQREPLPKSGPGKVLKRVLRAPFWEGVIAPPASVGKPSRGN